MNSAIGQDLGPSLCRFLLVAVLSEGPACSWLAVDAISLASERFLDKRSIEEVDRLSKPPVRPYQELADLPARGRSASLGALQRSILERAAGRGDTVTAIRYTDSPPQ